ncbi:GlxA family transcriptional regulator [Actinomycetospora aeridis]|uniref:Helix-turn-helix domain-containing protein n=1 Tax=Actinomycetospora aeridis TaxID=3129231 RepID=A0ABU8NDL8_9PSEU
MEQHRIAVLVRDGVLAMELGVVHRVFGEACDAEGRPFYDVTTCALEAGSVRTDGDFFLEVEHGPELLSKVSTVIVASTDHDAVSVSDAEQSAMTAALRRVRPGTRLASICTAAFLLAAAGLLDGRDATTHWARVAAFRERFPTVRVRPEVLYTEDGNILTSAGVASVADMCLHMVRSDHGAAVGGVVSRRVVMPPHRQAGEAQLTARPVAEDGVAGTARARSWALEHLDEPLSLRDLAEREGISTRTLSRRFREETGTSPTQWLLARRLERARELLETTELGVDMVAARCGFGSSAAMRLHMRAVMQVSPSVYRRNFHG